MADDQVDVSNRGLRPSSGKARRASHAFARRDFHRRALNAHMLALLVGLLTAFAVNRFATPDFFWAHWVAAAWGVLFLGHLAVFSRATLQTMGGAKKAGTGGAGRVSN